MHQSRTPEYVTGHGHSALCGLQVVGGGGGQFKNRRNSRTEYIPLHRPMGHLSLENGDRRFDELSSGHCLGLQLQVTALDLIEGEHFIENMNSLPAGRLSDVQTVQQFRLGGV